jgi:hypothetical protein
MLDDEDAEETPFMWSKMAFICCNISVHLDIDSDAESSDTVAMANSIWGKKFRVPKLKAPNTNCYDPSLQSSNYGVSNTNWEELDAI